MQPIKPYNFRLNNISIFKYKKILVSLRKNCKSENIEIKSERIKWTPSLLHPFNVSIRISGTIPIPEEDIKIFRDNFHAIHKKTWLKDEKEKHQKKRKKTRKKKLQKDIKFFKKLRKDF